MIELKNRVDPGVDLSFQTPLPVTGLGIVTYILYYKLDIYTGFLYVIYLENIKCTKYIFKVSKTQ